jgi:phenylpyruvate tautomerase PptA (4-oxalocrotonate tautomerase family)
MPLLRFDLIEGRDEQGIKSLLDAAHRAVVKALGSPERDRFQIVHQHPAHEMVIQDVGLGIARSKNVVVISVTANKRTQEKKQALYKALMDELTEHCALRPQDIMISLVDNTSADWSIAFGEAQFLTGRLSESIQHADATVTVSSISNTNERSL